MRRTVTYILSAAFILIFPFLNEAIEDDAMVLYYSFDAGKGKEVEDLSGKENHGTLEANANGRKTGRLIRACFLMNRFRKGSSRAPASDSLAITKNLTMEVWVYPESVGDYRNVRGQAGPPHVLSEYPSR